MTNHPNRAKITPAQRAILDNIDTIYLSLEGADGFLQSLHEAQIVPDVSAAVDILFPATKWGRARAAGWRHGGDNGGFWFHQDTWGSWKAAASWAGSSNEPTFKGAKPAIYDTVDELIAGENI